MIALGLILLAIGSGPAEKVGRMEHPAIAEASGIVASRRHPGIFWVHNDSGNPPALFAVKKDGTLAREYRVAAPNVDWEDIAIDDLGHLYIGDLGDNLGKLPFHAIYRVDEPDPAKPADQPLKPSASVFFSYPNGEKRDAEALVIDDGQAIVIAKGRKERDAEVFAVPLSAGSSPLRLAKAVQLAPLPGFARPATGASLSADGTRLAVCAVGEIQVFRRGDGSSWLPFAVVEGPERQVEGVAWDGGDLILAEEGRTLYRIAESKWRRKVRPRP